MRVLILVVDGLQPAYLGPYGNEWIDTPTLDRWAAGGVVFDEHYADSPDPDAFERAIRTGHHPLIPPATCSDLLVDLQSAGVQIVQVHSTERDPEEPFALKPTRRAVRRAIEQLGDAPNALLWVEIDALLPPWQPSEEALADLFAEPTEDEETDEAAGAEPERAEPLLPWSDPLPERIAANDDWTFMRLQRTYAAAVASLDAGLERLLDDCTKRGWGEEALWVLTSGRGFPLGEHEAVGFTAAKLHEERIHLPLLLRWPNGEQAGLRVSALTQPADLAPTLRELFGIEMPESDDPLAGRSVVALARGGDHVLRPYAIMGQPRGNQIVWGLRSADWYLLLDEVSSGSRRLYVKPDDRWEVNDVYQRHLEFAEELEQQLRAMLNR